MKIRIYPKSLLETVWQQDKLLFTPEAEQPSLCLRCGQTLDRRLVINALSRYADVHICEEQQKRHLIFCMKCQFCLYLCCFLFRIKVLSFVVN